MGNFYIDKVKKIPAPDLFDGIAKSIAVSFSDEREDKYGNKIYSGISKTQLRRIYDEVKRFEQKLDGTKETWEKNCPYIRMIKSKVAYTISRAKERKGSAKHYDKLSQFISDGLAQVEDEKDFYVFSSLFEAVYGFYYERSPKDNN